MAVYHQMGHDSWNLVGDSVLAGFKGIILSPVNYTPTEAAANIEKLTDREQLQIIFDPQLYKPKTARGELVNWPHFSPEQDTTDAGTITWWKKRNTSLVRVASKFADSVCSPAPLSRRYNDAYYDFMLEVAEDLMKKADNEGVNSLVTVIVDLPSLAAENAALRLASQLSKSRVRRFYLIFHDDVKPRAQRTDAASLRGALQLTSALRAAGVETLIGFGGLDLVLWKAGRATDVATGKYFNLRRFSPSRWEEESGGGRVRPYWTDATLLTWLREDDFRKLDKAGLIDRDRAMMNPFSTEILEIIDENQGEPWLGLAWRQYLYWAQRTERAIEKNPARAQEMLERAASAWSTINGQDDLILFEKANNGSWIAPWLAAVQFRGDLGAGG